MAGLLSEALTTGPSVMKRFCLSGQVNAHSCQDWDMFTRYRHTSAVPRGAGPIKFEPLIKAKEKEEARICAMFYLSVFEAVHQTRLTPNLSLSKCPLPSLHYLFKALHKVSSKAHAREQGLMANFMHKTHAPPPKNGFGRQRLVTAKERLGSEWILDTKQNLQVMDVVFPPKVHPS